ncbi:MAG: septum formation initiator family protein [Acidobacteria bacterium]|nr:septum formation initiator family protein [Acidobacteriota bacterium]MBI3280443.1 septum formation initiator family protein [Acidobacteriota bacterium]
MKVALRKTGYLTALAVVCVYAFFAVWGPQGVPALWEKRRQIRGLQEKNVELTRENDMRRNRIRRLEQNRAEQELEIRKRLKLLRPGETTFVIPGEKPEDRGARPDAPASKTGRPPHSAH